MKRLIFFLAFSLFTLWVIAQPPAGYYDDAEGKTGETLKQALYLIIKDHSAQSYNGLWTAFQSTDKKPNGKVWDMYSDKPGQTPLYEYTFGSDQCGNYNSEGDCYNREHSFPKSWFNAANPMYTDLFHLYPTDGYVNNRRGNYPFGRVGSSSWTSSNGSKLGWSNYPGYSGMVFEPIDEYKGDFARSYFYMATRYHNVVANWSCDMLAGNQFPAFSNWALNLLIDWHMSDPVSQKEIDRNNAVYAIQENRNPFIDNPDYVFLIWRPELLTVSFTSTPVTAAVVEANYTYNIVAVGTGSITISCEEKPNWLNFNASDNGAATLSGTPTAQDIGYHSVKLKANNGNTEAHQNFSVSVTATNAEPVILNVTHTPTSPYNYQILTLNATVTNDDGPPSVLAFWGTQLGSITNQLTMQGMGNDEYECQLSIPHGISTLYYYIEATDSADQTATSTEVEVAIGPNVPPTINSVEIWPSQPNSSENVMVRALITDDDGNDISAALWWGFDEDDLPNELALQGQGSTFSGTIPAQPAQTTVHFVVLATDSRLTSSESEAYSYNVSGLNSVGHFSAQSLRIYPVPTSSTLSIILPETGASSFSVSNLLGVEVLRGNINGRSPEISIEVGSLPRGLYMLSLGSEAGTLFSKFIVE